MVTEFWVTVRNYTWYGLTRPSRAWHSGGKWNNKRMIWLEACYGQRWKTTQEVKVRQMSCLLLHKTQKYNFLSPPMSTYVVHVFQDKSRVLETSAFSTLLGKSLITLTWNLPWTEELVLVFLQIGSSASIPDNINDIFLLLNIFMTFMISRYSFLEKLHGKQ